MPTKNLKCIMYQRLLKRCYIFQTFIFVRTAYAPKVMAEVCDYRGCFGFLLCFGRGWRVGEHQFSSPNCPRSFQCGEHFPSSPSFPSNNCLHKKKRAIVKSCQHHTISSVATKKPKDSSKSSKNQKHCFFKA